MSQDNVCIPQQHLPICSLVNCTGIDQISIPRQTPRQELDIIDFDSISFSTKDNPNSLLKLEPFSYEALSLNRNVLSISALVLDFVDFLCNKHALFENINSIKVTFGKVATIYIVEDEDKEVTQTPLTISLLSQYKTSLFEHLKTDVANNDWDMAKNHVFMYSTIAALDCEHTTPKDELERSTFLLEQIGQADTIHTQSAFVHAIKALTGDLSAVQGLYYTAHHLH